MAVSAKLYSQNMQHFAKGEIAYLTDTIKVALMTASYAFNQDTHDTFADVSASEVATGAGYTARGLALGTKTVTFDATLNRTRLFAAASTWSPATGQSLTARYAVIYKDTGTNATSFLIGYVDLGVSVTATGSPLTLSWDTTNGILYIDVAA